jgi:hypothetical protein
MDTNKFLVSPRCVECKSWQLPSDMSSTLAGYLTSPKRSGHLILVQAPPMHRPTEREDLAAGNIKLNILICSLCFIFIFHLWSGNDPRVVTTITTISHACRKRRLKWVPGTWAYNWAFQSPGDINMETWSSRLGVGQGAHDPTPEKVNS